MTTNADYTFTPHPSPEEIQHRWNVSLDGFEDENENQAVVAHLRSIWKENWWKYPDNIKRSFLSAARKTATTKTNDQRPGKHVLFRGSVHFNRHDFDWGVWLVLRAIYYDANKGATSPRAQMTRSNFSSGPAKKMIMERYRGVDVLEANVPPTFPPRPRSWDKSSSDGPAVSSTSPKVGIGAASAGNQTSSSEGGGVGDTEAGHDVEMADVESDSSPSSNDATSRIKELATNHIYVPGQGGGSHHRANIDLGEPCLEAALSAASLDASLQDPANESDHYGEKAADTSNDGNERPDGSNGVPESLQKRSMSEDEEEDSSCGEHTQKRRRTSSDQICSTEPEAMSNNGTQKTTLSEELNRIHELAKKYLKETLVERVSQQLTREVEILQPRLKNQIAQSLAENVFGIAEISGLNGISKQVADSMAEQMASKITRQVVQKVTEKVTSKWTAKLQSEVDKKIADSIAQVMVEKMLGSGETLGP